MKKMNNRWRKITKHMDPRDLFATSSSTGRDKNFNSWVDIIQLSIDKGDDFEYKILAIRDRSAWHTLSFRKGKKHYAIKRR